MIDHININVRDFDASRAFYSQALNAARRRGDHGIRPAWPGMGNAGKPDLWISERGEPSGPSTSRSARRTAQRSMPSTRPRSRRAGPTTALRAPRPQYHENYYGAFVLDPDGNNLEAVCHRPPE